MIFNKINKRYKDVNSVYFVASTYSLLLYYMVYGRKQFEKTFFFVSDAISIDVQKKMKYVHYFSCNKFNTLGHFRQILYKIWIYRFSDLKWPFIKSVKFYGGDHLWFSPGILKDRQIIVFEDGLANYNFKTMERTLSFKRKWLYKFLYGPLMCEGEYGLSKQVSKLYLTGIRPIHMGIKDKVEIIDVKKLWDNCDQEYIIQLFDFTQDDINLIRSKKVLLLSQPFNVVIGDQGLVDVYMKVLSNYMVEDVLIKTHPRDTLDYSKYFPGVTIFTKKVPAEFLAFIGCNFTDVYTINSTSVFSFPKNINIHYLGYKCHSGLIQKYGEDVDCSLNNELR